MSIEALVLGGGLAGVACAKELAKHGARVTLVDRNDYHQFQPLLYQVATSQLPAQDIARPLTAIFAGQSAIDVVQAEVTAAKLSERTLILGDGRTLSADHLEWLDGAGVAALAAAGTVAVLLPGAFYVLRETRLPPIDALRGHGVPIAVATDCNPGTSPVTR